MCFLVTAGKNRFELSEKYITKNNAFDAKVIRNWYIGASRCETLISIYSIACFVFESF